MYIILSMLYVSLVDEPYTLSDAQWDDINVITGALKLFFRELPNPLIPNNLFDKFIEAGSTFHMIAHTSISLLGAQRLFLADRESIYINYSLTNLIIWTLWSLM